LISCRASFSSSIASSVSRSSEAAVPTASLPPLTCDEARNSAAASFGVTFPGSASSTSIVGVTASENSKSSGRSHLDVTHVALGVEHRRGVVGAVEHVRGPHPLRGQLEMGDRRRVPVLVDSPPW
jgi:hypothetical protein